MADINDDELWDSAPDDISVNEYAYEDPTAEFNPEDDSLYGNSEDIAPEQPADDGKEPDLVEDYLDRLLRGKGVDRNKVRIENDEGDIEEWKFDDLDDETKFNILSQDESPITDEEIDTINFLRDNKMNLRDFAEYQKKQAIQEYLSQNQTPTYTVDQVSDDDLFKFDLIEQMPDLTDEEVEDQLARAKESPSYFAKKVSALRAEYKELEDKQEQERVALEQQRSEEAFNQMASSLVDVARNTDEMDGMILDDSDKEDVLSFLLDRDANGQSQFYKLFEDPKALFEIAWYALKGAEANAARENYYKSEIAKARRAAKPQSETKPARTVRRAQNKSTESDIYGLDSVFNH